MIIYVHVILALTYQTITALFMHVCVKSYTMIDRIISRSIYVFSNYTFINTRLIRGGFAYRGWNIYKSRSDRVYIQFQQCICFYVLEWISKNNPQDERLKLYDRSIIFRSKFKTNNEYATNTKFFPAYDYKILYLTPTLQNSTIILPNNGITYVGVKYLSRLFFFINLLCSILTADHSSLLSMKEWNLSWILGSLLEDLENTKESAMTSVSTKVPRVLSKSSASVIQKRVPNFEVIRFPSWYVQSF